MGWFPGAMGWVGITEMIESAGLTSGTSHLAIQAEASNQETVEQLRVALGTPVLATYSSARI